MSAARRCHHGKHASIAAGAGPISARFCRSCGAWRIADGETERTGRGAVAYRKLIAALATGADDRAWLDRLPGIRR